MNAFTISIVLFFVFFTMAFQNSHAFLGGVPGGWSVADKTDPLVVEAVKFALQSAFPTNFMTLDFEILQANQQVVAGMNYDFTVRISNSDEGCVLQHFQVWDRFGNRQLTLNEKLQGC